MARTSTIVAIALTIAVATITAVHSAAAVIVPVKANAAPALPINPTNYAALLVVDNTSGLTLYERHATSVRSAASLTKLMTAAVFTSTPTKWDGSGSIRSSDEVGGGRLRVSNGTILSLRDVLYSAIIGSANNAAMALARMFDGKGLSAFIARMNAMVREIGLTQTAFVEPSGMDAKNVISARDAATLIHVAIRDQETAKAMKLPAYSFTMRSPKAEKTIKSTNDLFQTAPDIVIHAGKTGYLEESMYNFVTSVEPKGHREQGVTVVVLGASSRAAAADAALALARWAWSAYAWTSTTSSAPVLARDLTVGDRGTDVLALQKFLNASGAAIAASGPGAPGRETAYFGELTRTALMRYQERHGKEILTPRGASKASGYLDAMTRAFIQTGKTTAE